MTIEHVSEQQRRDIAVASTEAAAHFVATTLSVHGIEASTAAVDRVHPSLSWVEGYRVLVSAEEEARARELLAALSREDVVEVFPSEEDP